MTPNSWIMYLMLVLVATSTPGPAVLFITTHTALYGWQKAVFAALGNILGLFCLGAIAVTGLGAVLKTSEVVFSIIKYAGAAYLIYLGARLFLKKDFNIDGLADPMVPAQVSSKKIFWGALGVAISNPKAIVFLTALFPQFLDIRNAIFPQFFILISTLMIFSFFFLMLYALLAYRAKIWLMNPTRSKMVSRGSGTVFIGLGILLATASNK